MSTDDAPKPQIEAEPQNALTAKFTSAEWEAMKDLRTALPLIIEAAFPPETENASSKTIDMWGVPLDPTRVDDARLSVILVKFLRATDLDVEAAGKRLTATIKWREEFKANDTINETFPSIFDGFGYLQGKDKEGRPITYNVYGPNKDLKAIFGDLDQFLRWRVALMEKGLRQLDFTTTDSLVQVHDYNGVSMTSRDAASKKAASEATKLFGDHYPDLLHVKFFVNVPTFMAWIFWLAKTVIPAQTFAKLRMVGTGPATIGKEMLPYVDAPELPKEYGGTAASLQ